MWRPWLIALVLALVAAVSWAVETELETAPKTVLDRSLDTGPVASGGGCTLPFTLPCTLE